MTTNLKPADIVEIARRMFKAYCAASKNLTHDGKMIPTWENLTQQVRDSWCASAEEAVRYTSELIRAELARRSPAMLADIDKHSPPPGVRPPQVPTSGVITDSTKSVAVTAPPSPAPATEKPIASPAAPQMTAAKKGDEEKVAAHEEKTSRGATQTSVSSLTKTAPSKPPQSPK